MVAKHHHMPYDPDSARSVCISCGVRIESIAGPGDEDEWVKMPEDEESEEES